MAKKKFKEAPSKLVHRRTKYPFPYTKCEGCVFKRYLPLCQKWVDRQLIFSTEKDVEKQYKWCMASDIQNGVDKLKSELEESAQIYRVIHFMLRKLKTFSVEEYNMLCKKMDNPVIHSEVKEAEAKELKRKIFKRASKKKLMDFIQNAESDILTGEEEESLA